MNFKDLLSGTAKSKTMRFSAILILIGQLQNSGIVEAVPVQYQGMALSAIGLVVAVLRFVTTNAVQDKK